MRVYTKKGDVYCVKLDAQTKGYIQYIADDITQLNSNVIRAFKQVYPIDATPDIQEIVNDEVKFYAHCVVKWGVKFGFWEKIGNIQNVGETKNLLFRDSNDYGNPEIKVSENWWVWHLDEEHRYVGKLTGKNKEAEIGMVFSPERIVNRMKTGEYNIPYPSFE